MSYFSHAPSTTMKPVRGEVKGRDGSPSILGKAKENLAPKNFFSQLFYVVF